ncbi:hypothetical protein FACS1894110_26620 [Spirochaetia bacterium]|nr:hypothetical protein FACS1894110_26620 [Spirochaetia bacterium]
MIHTLTQIKQFKVRNNKQANALLCGISNFFFEKTLDIAEKSALKHPLYKKRVRLAQLMDRSDPIVHRSICSGECCLIPGEILHHAENGVKSFVILQPFGCLPNHVSGRGIVKRLKEIEPSIQILPLDYDPDTSFANIENRLQMLIMNSRSMAGDDVYTERITG